MTPADLTALAALVHGSIDPTTDTPTILTDSGRILLGLRAWHLYRPGRVEPPLGGWNAPVEDVAAAYWSVVGERVAAA